MILEGFVILCGVGGLLAACGMILLWFLLRRDRQEEAARRRTQALLDPIGDFTQLP